MEDNNTRFLAACRRQPVDATPVWMMRQAGRYMDEYRAIRAKHSMLDVINSPELATEITMQPIYAFNLDAAIIFADILHVLIGMGLNLEFVKGKGPVIDNPIRTTGAVDALTTPPPEENVPGTLGAIKLTREALAGKVPLIGFSGAPFTLASYAIEGGGSKNYIFAKSFMYRYEDSWHQLMQKLSSIVSAYLIAQVEAGAQALQVFDSWAGQLSPLDYERYVLQYNVEVVQRVKAEVDVPVIYFGTSMNGMLPLVRRIPADVFGVDFRIPLDEAWEILGPTRVAVQGNLDPITLFAPWEELQRQADDVLERVYGRPGHIFNLGHGIVPGTPVDNVKRLCDYIHEQTAK